MSDRRDDYLWDRSGPVDRDVAALEALLARFGHGRSVVARRRRRLVVGLIVAAAAALIVFVAVRGDRPALGPEELPIASADGRLLRPGERLVADAAGSLLQIGEVGEVELAPGGSLRVLEAGTERTRLFLEHGRLEAFVGADARPRFFQVETPAVVCVDLGCRYVLEVDQNSGETHVRVTMGQVAFEAAGDAVYVPRGAEARALPGGRLGTPRFSDAPLDLGSALDAFDAAAPHSEMRAKFAAKIAQIAAGESDTLPLWHLLRDPDPEVVRYAEGALIRIAGLPPSAVAQKAVQRLDPEVWREHLDLLWWRPR